MIDTADIIALHDLCGKWFVEGRRRRPVCPCGEPTLCDGWCQFESCG